MTSLIKLANRRKARTRFKLGKRKNSLPRLSIFRSGRHIYAQIINDADGVTIVSASTLDKKFIQDSRKGSNVEAAKSIGLLIAEKAKSAGIGDVVFDRGGYKYHGRIKALADAAREGGLAF